MELETETSKLVDYIKGLQLSGQFQITRKGMRPDGPAGEHIGAVIVDATLASPRHNYEKQVRKRVEYLKTKYPNGATTSGFLRLIKTVGLDDILMGWEKEKDKKTKQTQVRKTAQLFTDEGIDTFAQLLEWIRKEENKLKLKKGVGGIGDKTADYYGVLVHDPEAVAIDERISTFLTNAGIDEKKYNYNQKKTLVQKTARQLGFTPLDLEQSIWHSNPKKTQEAIKMNEDGTKDALLIRLPSEKMELLKRVAEDEFATDGASLARFWIIERLLRFEVRRLPEQTPNECVGNQSAPETVYAKVSLPQKGQSWEISRMGKNKTERVIGKGSPLDLSTAVSKFGATWHERKEGSRILWIPIKLSIGSNVYDAYWHYREKTGGSWIGSELNAGEIKLTDPLRNIGLNPGDKIKLMVQGNVIQVAK